MAKILEGEVNNEFEFHLGDREILIEILKTTDDDNETEVYVYRATDLQTGDYLNRGSMRKYPSFDEASDRAWDWLRDYNKHN